MKNRIAAGFQNTVDYELVWDTSVIEDLIKQYNITYAEIENKHPITSERELILTLLYHMAAASGSECLTTSSEITRTFASHFSYSVTLGGTAIRAAIAIEKIGYKSTVHACSLNRHFLNLIPGNIHWIASVPDEGEDFHPHIIVQYPANIHLCCNDIDIVTKRPNRVIFTCDPPSRILEISRNFANEVRNTKVFLAASFNIIEDKQILQKRLGTTIEIIRALPDSHIVIMEDGCFKNPDYRQYVMQTLAPMLDIFSMNEDELQDRLGRSIDILNPEEVMNAIATVYEETQVDTLVCHSAYWALAYGKKAFVLENALEGGVTMAATRYRLGNDYNLDDYEDTKRLAPSSTALAFCSALKNLSCTEQLLCIPCKDLSKVRNPVTIGLGDAFVGGMLPHLLPEALRKTN